MNLWEEDSISKHGGVSVNHLTDGMTKRAVCWNVCLVVSTLLVSVIVGQLTIVEPTATLILSVK